MKIGFVTRQFPPEFGGGVGTYVAEVSRALAEQGHEVHVFTIRRPDDRPADGDPPGVHVHRLRWDPPAADARGLSGFWHAANEWLHAASLFHDALLDFAASTRLDIVEFPEWEAPGWLTLLSAEWTTPSVVNCHTPSDFINELNQTPALRGTSFEWLEMALADAVCAPCQAMADYIDGRVRLVGTPRVLPHPFDADAFCREPSPWPADSKRIAFVGRLEPRKGILTLMDAMERVWQIAPDVHLDLIGADTPDAPGGGSMSEYLTSRLTDATAQRVRFVGKVDRAVLATHLAEARFCVFPSRFENFPNVCLEAMAAGRAVIAGRRSGMVDMLADDGVYVDPDDAEGLAAKILTLWNAPERCAAIGSKVARRVRENFAPAKIAAARVAFYEHVVGAYAGQSSLDRRLARVDNAVWEAVMPDIADAVDLMLHRRVDEVTQGVHPVAERIVQKVAPERGIKRIAFYGAGQHTRKLLSSQSYLEQHGLRILAVIDDSPDQRGLTLGEWPIVSRSDAVGMDLDAVVLSSDTIESTLWANSEIFLNAGIEVVRLYHFPVREAVG
ncbi:MAG: glycosyltransferase [Deltaproteobacteria bacterium]|nr:glycosyltransferase [Deltaproteobacteria bacterium]MCB9487504.1 glycosyltransferase [Deltaproteobacteria bacterium]